MLSVLPEKSEDFFLIPLLSFFASCSILGWCFAAGQVWLWNFGRKISSKCLKYTLVHLQNPKQNRRKLICNWNSVPGKFREWVHLGRIAFLNQKHFWIARLLIIKKESRESSRGKTMGFGEVDFSQLRAAVLASYSKWRGSLGELKVS